MKLIHESASCLLHLLLLAEVFVQSSCRPTSSFCLCGMFGSMIHHVDRLMNSKKLHELTDEELKNFVGVEPKLENLPRLRHTASYFTSLKVNESLSQMYEYTQAFRVHVDWLKTAKDNVSLPVQSAEGASTHLLHLSNLIKSYLHQIHEEIPPATPATLPAVPTAFDALKFSVEIAEQLHVFCNWSKRVLRSFQRQCTCSRH
ncbi:uncharacterized protein il11b [Cololabis saira]|uniref:uncharacterized protein il11b n=1 Tax=Cololabis saira TaxID=129043 RepID=UPI002AD22B64|nr:uncharacterized protein il11b [Cololabis saira]